MPGLRLYGRVWRVADDDLVLPLFCESVLRAAWLTYCFGSIVWFFVEYPEHAERALECPKRHYLYWYIGAVAALCAVITVTAFGAAWISASGSISDPRPRRHLKYWLYARFVLYILEILLTVGGAVWLYGSRGNGKWLEWGVGNCPGPLPGLVKNTVKGSFVMIALYAVFMFILSRPAPPRVRTRPPSDSPRLQSCINTLFRAGAKQNIGTAKSALHDVAAILATQFANSDLTFSDVLAGLMIVDDRRSHSQIRFHDLANPTPPKPDKPEWMNLTLAARMIDYAAGSYGYPHFTAAYGPLGLCRAFGKMSCPPCNKPRAAGSRARILGDNCCYCNTAVMLQMTDAYGPEIRYFTLHNKVYEVPFFVMLDHTVQHVVVVVRGSLTMEDFITDLMVVPEQYDVPDRNGGTRSVRGHKGFFESAKYIANQLRTLDLLNPLFEEYPSYDLCITGQSLGAGVAPPLALLLRSDFPRVRCFAFSPPGCVIARSDIDITRDIVCTPVVGDDLVSHMSLRSLATLRQEILYGLKTCHLPKYRIFHANMCCCLGGDDSSQKYMQANMGCAASDDKVNSTDLTPDDLCLPGTIMYLGREGEEDWKTSWEDADSFHQVILSKSVVDHHFPFTVSKVMKEALKQRE